MARLFDVLENPIPGSDWYLRKMKYENRIGTDDWVWTVQLMKRADGTPVEFSHESLHMAWVRACEAANAHHIGLYRDDDVAGQSLS